VASAFVIRNQLGQYLSKKEDWVSGRDASSIFFKTYYDEALNQLFEANTKDINLRGKVCEVELDEKKRPLIAEFGPEPEAPHADEGHATGDHPEGAATKTNDEAMVEVA